MQYKSLKKGNISKHDNDAYPENLRVLGHPGNNQTMPHKKALTYAPPSAILSLLSIGVEMEPKWRDMCQIELSARTNRGWDGGGGETPLTISRNLAREPLPRPWGRHLDCFRSEHALLKIHKKGCGGSAGYPPSSSSDVRIYACASRLFLSGSLPGSQSVWYKSATWRLLRIPGATFYVPPLSDRHPSLLPF